MLRSLAQLHFFLLVGSSLVVYDFNLVQSVKSRCL
jgi:hypothetical protein